MSDKSAKEIRNLINLKPTTAFKIINNERVETEVENLLINDILEVRPGERIPIDCIIIEGQCQIDISALTGEAFPQNVTVSDELFSGSINLNSIIRVSVTNLSADSMLQKVIKIVEEASTETPKSQAIIEKYESSYVLAIFVTAILIALFAPLLFNIDQADASYKAIILLIVASPCAIMASVVPASLAAIAHGARHGLLIKGSYKLEELSRVKAICFDKTGTLTKGKPTVLKTVLADDFNETKFLSLIASLEFNSNHPLAKAVVDYTKQRNIERQPISNFIDLPGSGISGIINETEYFIGNLQFIKKYCQDSKSDL